MRFEKTGIKFKFKCIVITGSIVFSSMSITSASSLGEGSTRVANTNQIHDRQEKKLVRKELRWLKRLSRRALRAKAKKGDNLAGLALAYQFSSESASLAAIPVLANSAAEDAIRWYNQAAQASALHLRPIVGLSVLPLRASRARRR